MTVSEAPADTLFGWPAAHTGPERMHGLLCVLGAPTDHGSALARGAASGPGAIRAASAGLMTPGHYGRDAGDIVSAPGVDLAVVLQRLAGMVEEVLELGMCPLVIGGDHSITYAPVSVLQQREEICLVWFDAHTDFSPWAGGEAHSHKQVLRRISSLAGVRKILQIGYRGLTTEDERRLGPDITVVTSAATRDLDEDALLALVPAGMRCYLSIDIDIIDPAYAPGTGAPVPDGLTPEELERVLRILVRHRRVAGLDLVEVNPRLDPSGHTASVAARLLGDIAAEWERQIDFTSPSPVDMASCTENPA